MRAADLTISDETHAIQAAIAGQGVALLSRAMIADELAGGKLVVPFGPELASRSYHLAYRKGARDDPRIQKVRGWQRREASRVCRSPA